MSAGIILVRHAMPEVRPGVASVLWGIAEAAREDCVLLSHHLPADIGTMVFSSDERKARETAAVVALRRGLTVSVDDRLGEVDRPDAWTEDYRATAEAYLRGGQEPGWESRDRVVSRFSAAANRTGAAGAAGDLVLVNHGLALSLYLDYHKPTVVTRDGRMPFDLVPFWRALSFPDAWRFDPAERTVTRVFAAGRPPPDA